MSLTTSSAKGHVQAIVEDDLTLILRMACKDSDYTGAEAALVTFFQRHHQLLKGFAEKNNFRSLGFDPEDFVLKTFHIAFEKADTFDAPAGISPERLLKKVQSWLFEIAKNEFLMELRRQLNQSEETRDPEFVPPPDRGEVADEVKVLSGKAAVVRTFLDGLPEGDRQLLETSMNFYDHTARRAVIPEDILAGLATALGTTPEGIKQKRKRLLQKLKTHIENT